VRIFLEIWRQRGPKEQGRLVKYELPDVTEHMSFLEMLDVLNVRLVEQGEEPVAFDSDCREGICGMCGFLVNGEAHGPLRNATICQTATCCASSRGARPGSRC
jgi:succinate dehydrogenase / fumarate reductase iron-sulfur subunit